MLSRKKALVLACCSLAAGALALILAGPPGSPEYGGSYAVLLVDAAYPDRFIGELLARGAAQGPAPAFLGDYVSESTQWVFLDDFGELTRLSLDDYSSRVEAFDPRNDGYAGRLTAFFVHGGERRFFIPLPPRYSSRDLGKLREALTASLGEIPFSLQVWGRGAGRDLLIRAEEYERHAAFQTAFSERPLERGPPEGTPFEGEGYLRYYLGEDGLISGAKPFSPFPELPEVPPFPLADLMNFLAGEDSGEGRRALSFRDLTPVWLIISAGLPAWWWGRIGRQKKLRVPMVNDKRIAV